MSWTRNLLYMAGTTSEMIGFTVDLIEDLQALHVLLISWKNRLLYVDGCFSFCFYDVIIPVYNMASSGLKKMLFYIILKHQKVYGKMFWHIIFWHLFL